MCSPFLRPIIDMMSLPLDSSLVATDHGTLNEAGRRRLLDMIQKFWVIGYSIFQCGGGMTIYYKEKLCAHEHHPDVPDQYKYLNNERQWLLVDNHGQKIAFLRYFLSSH